MNIVKQWISKKTYDVLLARYLDKQKFVVEMR